MSGQWPRVERVEIEQESESSEDSESLESEPDEVESDAKHDSRFRRRSD